MTTPSWVTAENIKFNGTLDNVAILKDSGGIRTLVLWDNLPAYEQSVLEALVNDYGGDAPLASPSAGYQTVAFNATKVGGSATGLANDSTVYTATVNIDGTILTANITGSAAQTFTDLITELDADLTGATSAVSGGNLVITSSITGTGSLISITGGTLFRALTDFQRIVEPKEGVNDLVEAMQQNKAPNGEFLINVIPTKRVSTKPATTANVPHSPAYLYFGGSPAAWRYLDDDTEFVVCSGGGGGGGDVGSTDFVFGSETSGSTDFVF